MLTTSCSGKQFDVNDAILDALKNLEVTLDIDSSVKIDDCKLRRQFIRDLGRLLTQ